MSDDRWVKGRCFWRRTGPYENSGICDYIFNHCTKILMDQDDSLWAVRSFLEAAEMLQDGKRWPDHLTPEGAAPTRWVYWPLKWLGVKKYTFRAQDDLTRDPFIAMGAVYVWFMSRGVGHGKIQPAFKATKIPWWLYRTTTFRWRRRLIKDSSKHYVKRLRYLRAYATVKYFETTNKLWLH